MINLNKVTEIFCLVDEFCEKFDIYIKDFIIANSSELPTVMSKNEVISTLKPIIRILPLLITVADVLSLPYSLYK